MTAWRSPQDVDQLSDARRMAYFRSMMREVLGKKRTDQMWSQIEPVVRDSAGQGDETVEKRLVGDADDPTANYWNGTWQIYSAD